MMQLQGLRISCDRRGDPAVKKPKTVITEFNDILEDIHDRNVLAIYLVLTLVKPLIVLFENIFDYILIFSLQSLVSYTIVMIDTRLGSHFY